MGLIVHKEGCDAIRCTCNRPKTLKEVIEQLEEKKEEPEQKKKNNDSDLYGCA
mgnify:FL=1